MEDEVIAVDEKLQKRHRGRFYIVLVVVTAIVVGVALFAWLRPRTLKVQLETVRRTTMTSKILSSGTVRAEDRQVVQATELTAPISRFAVHVGQRVHVGQVLIVEKNDAQQAALQAARNGAYTARRAQSEAQAQVQAAPPGFQNQLAASLSNAENAYAQAEAQLGQAQAAYDATLVRSRVNGRVILENPDGYSADGNPAPLLEVVSEQKQIVVNLSEVDAVRLSVGMKAQASTDAFPNQTWNTTVSEIAGYAATMDSGAGQVEVDLAVPTAFPVPYGYQMDVQINSTTHRGVPSVPYDALVQNGDEYAVFLYQNGHVHKVDVTVGITGDVDVEVTKGLKPGERVLLNPPSSLQDGEAVDAT